MTRKTGTPEERYPTRYLTNVACQFLEKRAADPATPFKAVVSYPDPHHPFTAPGKYFEMYSPDDFDLPDTFSDTHLGGAPHYLKAVKEGPSGLRKGVNMLAPACIR